MKSDASVTITADQANQVRLALIAAQAYLPDPPADWGSACWRCHGPVEKGIFCERCAAEMVRDALKLMQDNDPRHQADLAAFRAAKKQGAAGISWPCGR